MHSCLLEGKFAGTRPSTSGYSRPKPNAPPRMFFLKKIFQLRDQSNPSAEKPFLEHLEDLRVCITRVVLALLLSTVVCFVFRNELMDVIRRPVTQVWEQGQKDALKDSKIALEDWETAKEIAESFNQLQPEDRTHFLSNYEKPEEVLANIRIVTLYRSALTFPEEAAQQDFIKTHEDLDPGMQEKILALLEGRPNPKSDARGKLVLMQALKPTEGFMLSIKLAFFAGIVVSFPFLLYFILQFVLPGMHESERRALWPAMAIGFGLFLAGVFFSYFIVLPKVLEFFHEYSSDMMIENEWRIGYYISFATQFTLIFGLSFELPVLVMTLVRLGVLNCEMMRRTRAYAILAIFCIAAIITPTPDAFTLCLLAGPMVILYEICIWLAFFLERKTARREAMEEKERMERMLEIRKRRDELGIGSDDDDDDHDGGGHPPDGDNGPGTGDPSHHSHYDEYGSDHDVAHDHDPEDYRYHTDDDSFRQDHHEEGDLGFGDDGHTGTEESSEDSEKSSPSQDGEAPKQQGFDFREEFDPSTGRSEPEDADSDHDEGEGEYETDNISGEGEYLDPHDPPEDVPDEEKYRDRDDPDKRDQD